MISAKAALARLQEGNARFVEHSRKGQALNQVARPADHAEQQAPFAIILCCSDSRVPAEIIFNQGLGDLFVVRVAGNVVAPTQIDSVEFAVTQLGARLVLVLGHSNCGAVTAAVHESALPPEQRPTSLRAIINRILPSVEALQQADPDNPEPLLPRAIRANIQTSVEQLRSGSSALADQIANHGLMIVGAEYSLETGEVQVLR